MKYNGLLMDEAAMIRKQGECAAKLIELRDKIREIIGDVDIGANAGTQAFKDPSAKCISPKPTTAPKR